MNSINNIISKLQEARIQEANSPKEEMQNNATYKKIDELCNKYGYNLYAAYVKVYSDQNVTHVDINKPTDNRYLPEIYFTDSYFGNKVAKFEIQTTSYGSLDISEYENFLLACQDAFTLVKELNKLDLTQLYHYTEEE